MCVYGLFLFFRVFFFCAPRTLRVHSAELLVRKAAQLGTLVGDCSIKQNLLEIETQQILLSKSRFGADSENVELL